MLEPGVYFGLDENTYHAEPALSASGIKHLQVSPLDFWVRSWMNPDFKEEETDSLRLGKLCHKRIVEGQDAFEKSYALPPDIPFRALKTMDSMKAWLKHFGLRTTGNKAELTKRLKNYPPFATLKIPFYDDLVEAHEKANAGKKILSLEESTYVEFAAAYIEGDETLAKCFSGGYPEVSVFWTDEEFGVPMKSRIDYLKIQSIIDYKTFANKRQAPVENAVLLEMANYKYHVQAATYDEGAAQIVEHIKAGRVHGDADQLWLDAYSKIDDREFVFVFQQTGLAPVAVPRIFPKTGGFDVGRAEVREAKMVFKNCLETYGEKPWAVMPRLATFDDSEFPEYMWRGRAP